MIKTLRVNADHGPDFHPAADHMTKFSAFPFSLHLMFDQTISNLVVCLMVSQKHCIKNLHKRASMS